MNTRMKKPKSEPMVRITVTVPAYLLKGMGMGPTELIRKALEEYHRSRAAKQATDDSKAGGLKLAVKNGH